MGVCSGGLHTQETGVCVHFENQCHQSFPLFPESQLFPPKLYQFVSLRYISRTRWHQSRFSILTGDTLRNVRQPFSSLLKICHNKYVQLQYHQWPFGKKKDNKKTTEIPMPFLLMLKLQFGQSLPNFHMLVDSSIYIFWLFCDWFCS